MLSDPSLQLSELDGDRHSRTSSDSETNDDIYSLVQGYASLIYTHDQNDDHKPKQSCQKTDEIVMI